MTENTYIASGERPLVTFAVFSYNQEEYIREAVEGAFSQTYEPLEIILSDDGSSDRTFEIMRELAAVYQGPHRVLVRQSHMNQGLIDHVVEVAEIALGILVVFAAGDDVSLSNRVHEVVAAWDGQSSAVFSAYDLIDPEGRLLQSNVMPEPDATKRFPWLRDVKNPLFVYGATSVYEATFLKQLPRAGRIILSEDTPLNLMLQLSERSVSVSSKSLVRYRVHSKTLSNSLSLTAKPADIVGAEIVQQKKFNIERNILIYLRDEVIPRFSQSCRRINHAQLDLLIVRLKNKAEWRDISILQKLQKIIEANSEDKKWMLLRIFGPKFYAFMKATTLALRGAQGEWSKH